MPREHLYGSSRVLIMMRMCDARQLVRQIAAHWHVLFRVAASVRALGLSRELVIHPLSEEAQNAVSRERFRHASEEAERFRRVDVGLGSERNEGRCRSHRARVAPCSVMIPRRERICTRER